MSAAANSMDKHSGYFTLGLEGADPEVFNSVQDELNRQRDKIELIASENIVSKAVLEAQGSVLTNKYAEGYPGKRYYGGCEYVDVAEQLAIDRACKLFGAAFANVQPVTHVVNALRELTQGTGTNGRAALYAIAWALGILVVAATLAVRRLRNI